MSRYSITREASPFGPRYVARLDGLRIGSAPTERQAMRIINEHKAALKSVSGEGVGE